MSSRTWMDRVQDILDAIVEIEDFTQGMDYEVFQTDHKTIKAVELDFIVIGEAANHIPDDVRAAHPEVPWQLMRALRNRLVHVYFSVEPQIIWETVRNDLPSLKDPLKELLAAQNSSCQDPDTV